LTVPAPAASRSAGPTEISVGRLYAWFGAVVVVAAVPRLLTAGHFVTTDEPTWMNRSVRFSDALGSLDLSQASASVGEPATMPGGPLMWIGTVARLLLNAAHSLGLVDQASFKSPQGLATAQYLSAIVVALLIGSLFVVTTRWAGLVPGLLAAALVATEPWFVGLGAVLHSDELTALLGTIGLILLARALGIPRAAPVARPRLTAALAGAALMGAALTKLTGAGFWTGAAVLAVWATVVHLRRGGRWLEPGSPVRLCLVAAVVGLVLVPLAWPALVVDPRFQLERLVDSAGLAGDTSRLAKGTVQFYRGRATDDVGWSYYFVASALRVTPWFLLAVLVGVPAAVARRRTRTFALALAAPVVALAVALAAASKAYDRYAVLVLVPLAVVAAIGVDDLVRPLLRGRAVAVTASLGAAMFLFTLFVVPWGLAFFNPALGGSAAGRDTLLVGWGEGQNVAQEKIEALEGGDCSRTTVKGLELLFLSGWSCTAPAGAGTPEYVVLYVSELQRNPALRDAVEGRELVDTVQIRGITYAEIWK
jgi:hypothetical protein